MNPGKNWEIGREGVCVQRNEDVHVKAIFLSLDGSILIGDLRAHWSRGVSEVKVRRDETRKEGRSRANPGGGDD